MAQYILQSKWINSYSAAIIDLLTYPTTRLSTESYRMRFKLSECHTKQKTLRNVSMNQNQ